MKQKFYQLIRCMVVMPLSKIATELSILFKLPIFIISTIFFNSSIMADTTINHGQKTEMMTTVNSLRPHLVRLDTANAIPDDFKQLLDSSEYYGKKVGWYLHDGDLIIAGNFEADLPLLVRGHLVVSGDMSTKIYHELPVMVTGDVVAQSITIQSGWLNAGGNVVTKAVILEDHDSSESFIGANGLVYTELFSTYGDACVSTKIIESAIEFPIWHNNQTVHQLAPEFASRLPQAKPADQTFYDQWQEWSDNKKGEALFAELLTAVKENRSIRNANAKTAVPAVPDTVQCWQQNTSDTKLKALAQENEHLALCVALRPWPLSAQLQGQLSHDNSVNVRNALAQRQDLTDSVLKTLCNDSSSAVKALLISHYPSCVQPLDANSPFEIRLRYAQSQQALDHGIVATLVADPDAKVRLALSSQSWLDFASLQLLMFDDPDIAVRRNAVRTAFRQGGIDQVVFLRLIADTDEKIRRMTAKTEIWPQDKRFDRRFVIEQMLASSDPIVRSAGASSFIEWPDLAAKMAQDADPKVRKAAAVSIFTPPQFLRVLAEDSDFEVRNNLANNFLAPTDVLDKLVDLELKSWRRSASSSSKDDSDRLSYIRKLQRHPAMSPDALRKMQGAGIRGFSAESLEGQANWPAEMVIYYGLGSALESAEDNEIAVIEAIKIEAVQQQLLGWSEPSKILTMMLESHIDDLERFAATSRFTPPEALRRYAQRYGADEDYEDSMENIAQNPATPEDLLLTWVDQDRYIYPMLHNPELSLAVLNRIADVPPSIQDEKIVTSQSDDSIEMMPKIVFGKDRQRYAEYARTLLKAREGRGY